MVDRVMSRIKLPTGSLGRRRGTLAGTVETGRMAPSLRRMLLPLVPAQFICSFAGSNMNVMINDINKDLNTTVQGVQIAYHAVLVGHGCTRSSPAAS